MSMMKIRFAVLESQILKLDLFVSTQNQISNLQHVFPSEHNLRRLTYVLLHATKAWAQPRWFQWRSRKLMESRRELMKPSCFRTIALRAGIKRCQLHSRKAVQQKRESVDGGRRSSAQASGIEESKETWRQAKSIEVLVLAWGEGVLVIVGVGVGGGISQRLRPRGEGGRRNADPTNAFALLSLAVLVDNSLALYAQLQFLLELRPREARPEHSSMYVYIYIYIYIY